MLNGYLLEKKYNEFRKIPKKGNMALENTKDNSKYNKKLICGYRDRIHKFLADMAESPIVINNFVPNKVQHERQERNTKKYNNSSRKSNAIILRPEFSIRGFKTDRERIKEALESHRMLHTDPLTTHMRNHEFRSRDVNKEIQPKMRFKANTDLERVHDKIKQSAQIAETKHNIRRSGFQTQKLNMELYSEDEGSDPGGEDTESKKQPNMKGNIGSLNYKPTAKILRPDLHQKTHFQTISSIYNGQTNILKGRLSNRNNSELDEALISIKNNKLNIETDLNFMNRCKSLDYNSNILQSPRKLSKEIKYPENIIDSSNPLHKKVRREYKFEGNIYDYLNSMGKSRKSIRKDKCRADKKLVLENNKQEVGLRGNRVNNFLTLDSIKDLQHRKTKSKAEVIAGEVLSLCNLSKKRVNSPRVLRKGEGHLMSGFGANNKFFETISDAGKLIRSHKRILNTEISTLSNFTPTPIESPSDKIFTLPTMSPMSPAQKIAAFLHNPTNRKLTIKTTTNHNQFS